MTEAAKLLNKQLERGKIDDTNWRASFRPSTDSRLCRFRSRRYLLSEAVVENRKSKSGTGGNRGRKCAETVLASNTSTIPIGELAESATERRKTLRNALLQRYTCRMPLVEIIRGEEFELKPSPKSSLWASKMGKTPIVVSDCPGFFVNACCSPISPVSVNCCATARILRKVDKVMEKQFGWPMGRLSAGCCRH
ncbi:hypothetical protein KCP78_20110 [Salmonella enterica subsp. enterica]|nr:hypothetical protein KCP78_20110 [Salmonella enterica subsp. enterica]